MKAWIFLSLLCIATGSLAQDIGMTLNQIQESEQLIFDNKSIIDNVVVLRYKDPEKEYYYRGYFFDANGVCDKVVEVMHTDGCGAVKRRLASECSTSLQGVYDCKSKVYSIREMPDFLICEITQTRK